MEEKTRNTHHLVPEMTRANAIMMLEIGQKKLGRIENSLVPPREENPYGYELIDSSKSNGDTLYMTTTNTTLLLKVFF